MTHSDDDIVARVRATFQATAARTPISAGRFDAIAAAPAEKRSNTLVISMSAAAAVAAIAGVAAVVANSQGGAGNSVVSVGGSPSGSIAPSSAISAASAAGVTPSPSAAPGTAPASDPANAGGCALQNYFVTASQAQLAGLTYMLPATPAGYHLYGAWGTIDRSMCADTATWYVEYDDVAGDTDNNAIQLTAHRSYPGEPDPTQAPDSAVTRVSVGGQPAGLIGLNGKGVGVLEWTRGDINFQLVAPMAGSSDSIVALADSIVAVPTDDPRIKAPTNCEVPAGQVCGGDGSMAKATPTPTPSAQDGATSGAPQSAPASLAVG